MMINEQKEKPHYQLHMIATALHGEYLDWVVNGIHDFGCSLTQTQGSESKT